nr:hypothetical protein [Streptomyces sp. DH20]
MASLPLISGNKAAFSPGAGQYHGVADLLWDGVKCSFDPHLMGSLPDVSVPDASGHNWQDVLDLIVDRGLEVPVLRRREGGLPLPRAEAALSRPADAECPNLRVWLRAEVAAILRFYADEEIDFDVALRELQTAGAT